MENPLVRFAILFHSVSLLRCIPREIDGLWGDYIWLPIYLPFPSDCISSPRMEAKLFHHDFCSYWRLGPLDELKLLTILGDIPRRIHVDHRPSVGKSCQAAEDWQVNEVLYSNHIWPSHVDNSMTMIIIVNQSTLILCNGSVRGYSLFRISYNSHDVFSIGFHHFPSISITINLINHYRL